MEVMREWPGPFYNGEQFSRATDQMYSQGQEIGDVQKEASSGKRPLKGMEGGTDGDSPRSPCKSLGYQEARSISGGG
jgi:hypothetical protein